MRSQRIQLDLMLTGGDDITNYSIVLKNTSLPPVSPRHFPTTTSHLCLAGPASLCPPSRWRPLCPACLRVTAAQQHREDSTSCVAPMAAAKPGCFTTTMLPAAASFPCWLMRLAWNSHFCISIYCSCFCLLFKSVFWYENQHFYKR